MAKVFILTDTQLGCFYAYLLAQVQDSEGNHIGHPNAALGYMGTDSIFHLLGNAHMFSPDCKYMVSGQPGDANVTPNWDISDQGSPYDASTEMYGGTLEVDEASHDVHIFKILQSGLEWVVTNLKNTYAGCHVILVPHSSTAFAIDCTDYAATNSITKQQVLVNTIVSIADDGTRTEAASIDDASQYADGMDVAISPYRTIDYYIT